MLCTCPRWALTVDFPAVSSQGLFQSQPLLGLWMLAALQCAGVVTPGQNPLCQLSVATSFGRRPPGPGPRTPRAGECCVPRLCSKPTRAVPAGSGWCSQGSAVGALPNSRLRWVFVTIHKYLLVALVGHLRSVPSDKKGKNRAGSASPTVALGWGPVCLAPSSSSTSPFLGWTRLALWTGHRYR